MKIKTVEYRKLFNVGNFQNHAIGLNAEIKDGENANKALLQLADKVEALNTKIKNLRTNEEKVDQLQESIRSCTDDISQYERDIESFVGKCPEEDSRRITNYRERIKTAKHRRVEIKGLLSETSKIATKLRKEIENAQC